VRYQYKFDGQVFTGDIDEDELSDLDEDEREDALVDHATENFRDTVEIVW
jgi:hypothetical protein